MKKMITVNINFYILNPVVFSGIFNSRLRENAGARSDVRLFITTTIIVVARWQPVIIIALYCCQIKA